MSTQTEMKQQTRGTNRSQTGEQGNTQKIEDLVEKNLVELSQKRQDKRIFNEICEGKKDI